MPPAWIWSETTPYEELASPRVVHLLRRFDLRPLIAVQPRQLQAFPSLSVALQAEGIVHGAWPMLEDTSGRWASASNAFEFLAFCDRVLDATSSTLSAFAIDLEPDIQWVRTLVGGPLPRLGQGSAHSFGAARSALISFAAALHARGLTTLAAAAPLVLHDRPGPGGWQRILGTPATEVGFGSITAMAYPSLVEGWSRGLLNRQHARALLALWAERAAQRGLGLSLGAVGVGALGSEPRYRSPAELAEDVALARHRGVEALTLLDLGGVLARPPAEAWLEALSTPASAATEPPPSRRVGALVAALDLGGRAGE